MKCSLGISNFLEEISSLSHSLFSSSFLHWSLRKAFLSLLAILWNSAFRCVYLSFSPLPLAFLFSASCKASSDNHFAFVCFFSLGMVLITTFCTVSWTSFHSFFLGTPSIRSNPLNLFVTYVEWSCGFPYFLQFKSECCDKEFTIWATVSSRSCF